eukprot:jgi/Hompol1/940/HPOL_004132-RA
MAGFFRERAAIEERYAADLAKLAKRTLNEKIEPEYTGTVANLWTELTNTTAASAKSRANLAAEIAKIEAAFKGRCERDALGEWSKVKQGMGALSPNYESEFLKLTRDYADKMTKLERLDTKAKKKAGTQVDKKTQEAQNAVEASDTDQKFEQMDRQRLEYIKATILEYATAEEAAGASASRNATGLSSYCAGFEVDAEINDFCRTKGTKFVDSSSALPRTASGLRADFVAGFCNGSTAMVDADGFTIRPDTTADPFKTSTSIESKLDADDNSDEEHKPQSKIKVSIKDKAIVEDPKDANDAILSIAAKLPAPTARTGPLAGRARTRTHTQSSSPGSITLNTATTTSTSFSNAFSNSPISVDSTILQFEASIQEIINVLQVDGAVDKILITGEISFQAKGVLPAHVPVNTVAHLHIHRSESLGQIVPNETFIIASPTGQSGHYTINLSAVAALGNATVQLFKYLVLTELPGEFSPLAIKPLWKIEDTQSSLLLMVETNKELLRRLEVQDLVITAPIQGGGEIGAVQTKPVGAWDLDKRCIQWHLSDLVNSSAADHVSVESTRGSLKNKTAAPESASKKPAQTPSKTGKAGKDAVTATEQPSVDKKKKKKPSIQPSTADGHKHSSSNNGTSINGTAAAALVDMDIDAGGNGHADADADTRPETDVVRRATTGLDLAFVPVWHKIATAGGLLSPCKPIFTIDSKNFFCGGAEAKMFMVETGLCVRTYTLPSTLPKRTRTISSMQINPHNQAQIYALYDDGILVLWDISTAQFLQSWETGFEGTSELAVHPNRSNHVLFIARETMQTRSMARSDNSQDHKPRMNQPRGYRSDVQFHGRTVLVGYKLHKREAYIVDDAPSDPVGISLFGFAQYGSMVVAASRTAFYLTSLNDRESMKIHRRFPVADRITALAVNPTQPFIATGDSIGRINLWYCFNLADNQKAISSLLHWHAFGVNYMAFSPDGTYLISGGEEAVLVLWQLETGNKQFIPRLDSEIRNISISADQMYYAATLKNNCIVIISAANMAIKQTIAGIKCASINRINYPLLTGIVLDPRTSALVLNGAPGTLQFYDFLSDRSITEVEVSARNRITRNDEGEILRPHIHHVQFSVDGSWMATIDVRQHEEFDSEIYLKFWKYSSDTGGYIANTRADAPHSME